ncbi:MAG: rod shape-determining protein MreC [Bacteroidetes bacterium]|nr:MAG: rod shape-determining protein MreC [Bacteroidota bacterium]
MRNLIAFFKRFQVFLFFALLQIAAFSLYFSTMSFPRSQYLTTASIVSGNILSVRNEVNKLFSLAAENRKLQEQNVLLRKQLPLTYVQLDRRLYQINDTVHLQRFEYLPATIINSTFDKRNNYFTLDIGKKQGVEQGMGVFSDKGVIGIVHASSTHFSVVKSVLTQDINMDVMVKETGAFGLLKWNASTPRKGQITGISNDTKVRKWQEVVTRGGSGIFPRGLSVGKICEIGTVEGKPLWAIDILFAEDYRKVQGVYVVKNLMSEELKAIEGKIPDDPDDE